ncbi:hypothetical protein D7Z26_10860 [Cohnella endophytica]|uniref:Uncharacterized protein n=1 Tax=Cohnella endophytica TaxID=2419778 RepID=A0A494XXZ3_9BACL|nr:hypothetical protein [Cohnella endophytica]RKP53889.1 hypothetical protein D7Z26_10860 [Cohnella endophytica]
MNRLPGIMKIHLQDKWGWIILPWVILMISFSVNLIIGSTSGVEIYTGGLASIHIYMLVAGIASVAQTFPFAISYSVRRKDYFLGTLATIAIISVGSAIILWALGYIESELTGGWGMKLHFFNLPYVSDSNGIGQIWIQAATMLHLFFLGFAISSIHRRFGKTGLYTFFLAIFIIMTVSLFLLSFYDRWTVIGDWLGDVTAIEAASGLSLLTMIYLLFSYSMLRRSTL